MSNLRRATWFIVVAAVLGPPIAGVLMLAGVAVRFSSLSGKPEASIAGEMLEVLPQLLLAIYAAGVVPAILSALVLAVKVRRTGWVDPGTTAVVGAVAAVVVMLVYLGVFVGGVIDDSVVLAIVSLPVLASALICRMLMICCRLLIRPEPME